MSRPSVPLVLFAVAEAVARGGLPEPAQVTARTCDDRVCLDLDLTAVGDLHRWARRIGNESHTRITTYRHNNTLGTVTTAHGRWHGAYVHLSCVEPAAGVEVAA